jgi:beta-galactosidase
MPAISALSKGDALGENQKARLGVAMKTESRRISRRGFVRSSLALGSLLWPRIDRAAQRTGRARWSLPVYQVWLFGGAVGDDAKPPFDDKAFAKITLPHSVAKLSWQDWDPAVWERVWAYQRHFTLPAEFKNRRVFVQFDGVMLGTSAAINGHALPEHLGGYLPFRYEITDGLAAGDNVLGVAVDSRWKNVPPEGSKAGPKSIDYLEPGGIFRNVSLCAVPHVFISDVFAKPVKVLDSDRHVVVTCSIDAGTGVDEPAQIKTELINAGQVISSAQQTLKIESAGKAEVALTLSDLGNISLWDVDTPRLYDVVTTLSVQGKPVHDHRVRVGFREARFDVDGFFLNGRRSFSISRAGPTSKSQMTKMTEPFRSRHD